MRCTIPPPPRKAVPSRGSSRALPNRRKNRNRSAHPRCSRLWSSSDAREATPVRPSPRKKSVSRLASPPVASQRSRLELALLSRSAGRRFEPCSRQRASRRSSTLASRRSVRPSKVLFRRLLRRMRTGARPPRLRNSPSPIPTQIEWTVLSIFGVREAARLAPPSIRSDEAVVHRATA